MPIPSHLIYRTTYQRQLCEGEWPRMPRPTGHPACGMPLDTVFNRIRKRADDKERRTPGAQALVVNIVVSALASLMSYVGVGGTCRESAGEE
jgi:hypothetical protein